MKLVGLIALSDPPRNDSAPLVAELHALGASQPHEGVGITPLGSRTPVLRACLTAMPTLVSHLRFQLL